MTQHALSYADLAMLVHDFKVPLSLVTLETQVLQEQLDDGAHVDMVRAISRVLRNVGFIERLVHELIDASTIEAGRFEVRRRPTELRDLVEGVVARWGDTPDRARVAVEAQGRIVALIDSLRVERVFANLLHNALVYSPERSPIMVKIRTLANIARVSVHDAAHRIPPHELDGLFDHYRIFAADYRSHGSALGLSISKQIIEAHGGRLGVTSSDHDGSEYFVELPLV